jgi:membrane protein
MNYLKTFFELIKETFAEWSEDRVPLLAAALAYYTAFALAPLIIIVVAVMGLVTSQSEVQAQIIEQIESTVGEGAAEFVIDLIDAQTGNSQGLIPSLFGIGALLVGALGIFSNLQNALNIMWDVEEVQREGGMRRFVKDKLLSFGMILVVGFLLMVSLVLSTSLSVAHRYFFDLFANATILLRLLNEVLALVITTVLFMAIYKILPHAEIQWRDVWVGATVTAVLFAVGRLVLSHYLGSAAPASAYGAAGAFVVILLWVYYSAQIILFGAEFTQVFARRYGSRIVANG